MRSLALLFATVLLCAARVPETIAYSVTPVPSCPACRSAAFDITLTPDGSGTFDGRRDVAAIGAHAFHATPAEVHAFTARLHRYRPNGTVAMTGPPFCREIMTDQDRIDIMWQATGAPPRHLSFDRGCDVAKNRKMSTALTSAPALLPLATLIGAARH